VRIIPGSPCNFKITSPDDLVLAELLLGEPPMGEYSGQGPLEHL
jgi:hypothetical protein